MKINIQILYSALRALVRLKKILVARSRAIIFQSSVKIYGLLSQYVDLFSVFTTKKIIRAKRIELKKGVLEKWSPGKKIPGKMVPGKKNPRKNDPQEKWSPENWSLEKWSLKTQKQKMVG